MSALAAAPVPAITLPDRDARRAAFLAATGWTGAVLTALPADMSFRRYFRCHRGGDGALLMDAPPGREDVRPWLRMQAHLAGLGLRVPAVLGADPQAGFVLIEDLGDLTFARLLEEGADPWPLYAVAIDVLIALQGRSEAAAVDQPPFDRDHIVSGALWLLDWQLPARRGRPATPAERADYAGAWHDLLDRLEPLAPTLVLRDYHPGNIMSVPGAGVAGAALIDFQDARIGAPCYDLMSLLEDARRDVPEPLRLAMRGRYLAGRPAPDPDLFEAWHTLLAAQQHLRVGGLFVRFLIRDSNASKLEHLPRVMRLAERALARPLLAPLRTVLDRILPDRLAPLPQVDRAALLRLLPAAPVHSQP